MSRLPALLVACATLVGGCAVPAPLPSVSVSTEPAPDVTTTAPAPTASVTVTSSPSPTSTSPTPTQCAARVVARLSVRQRAGQLVMVGVTGASAAELDVVRRLSIGSVILMGRHTDGVRGVRKLTGRLEGGRGLPMLVAVDQEGGLVQRLKGPGFDTIPSARVQATWSDATLQARAARWGRQLASAGVDWTLAPVADVVPPAMAGRNAPIGALGRGYGSNPARVAGKVTAFAKGIQSAGVTTSVKHFPGIGRVVGNTDFTAGVTDRVTSADDPYLRPFERAADAGAGSVMVSTVTYTRIDARHPAVFSPAVIGLIRDRLGFDGVVISDDLGAARSMAAVPAADRAIRFIRAGGDLAITVTPALADDFVAGIVRAARDNPAVSVQITRAATRVVALKVRQGLLPCG